MRRNFKATGFHYRKSGLVGKSHHFSSQHTSLQPGDRATDAGGLIGKDGRETTLHALLRNDLRCVVLITPGKFPCDPDLKDLRTLQNSLHASFPDLLEPILVTPFPCRDALYDSLGKFHEAYSAKEGGLFLIRPDGFLGFTGHPAEYADFEMFLCDRLKAVPRTTNGKTNS
jgi:hypothetical protein